MWKQKKMRNKDYIIIYNAQTPKIIKKIVKSQADAEQTLQAIEDNNGKFPSPKIYNETSRQYTENMSDSKKRELSDKVRYYSDKEIADDYEQLVQIGASAKDKSVYVTTGNKVVDRFTFHERLNTVGRNRLSFFEFWDNLDYFGNKENIKKLFEKMKNERKYENEYVRYYNIYRLYYGSVNIFRPILAMEYYEKYKPKTILDFTMGWGGRLVGACALNIHKYIGIDSNKRLEEPYQKLTQFLSSRSSTQIELYFKSALEIDYSKLNYDMVFTSPPYYNIERYNNTVVYKYKDDWDEYFYLPLFYQTYTYLKKGGIYVLNISIEIYERVCRGLLGDAHHIYNMKKQNRHNKKGENKTHLNTEHIYVWQK